MHSPLASLQLCETCQKGAYSPLEPQLLQLLPGQYVQTPGLEAGSNHTQSPQDCIYLHILKAVGLRDFAFNCLKLGAT